jgi:hypothetical protein
MSASPAATERDPFDDLVDDLADDLADDLEEMDPAEYDAEDPDEDEHDEDPAQDRRRQVDHRTHERPRTQHSTTQAALLELLSQALTAKIAHDVDQLPLALDALDAFTTSAAQLRTSITAEQELLREAHP